MREAGGAAGTGDATGAITIATIVTTTVMPPAVVATAAISSRFAAPPAVVVVVVVGIRRGPALASTALADEEREMKGVGV